MSAAIRACLCTAAVLALALPGLAFLSSSDSSHTHAHRSVTTQAAASTDDNGWW